MLKSTSTTQSLESLMDKILNHRRLNRETQSLLMQLLLGKTRLNNHEQAQVKEIFEALNQGRLRVVD